MIAAPSRTVREPGQAPLGRRQRGSENGGRLAFALRRRHLTRTSVTREPLVVRNMDQPERTGVEPAAMHDPRACAGGDTVAAVDSGGGRPSQPFTSGRAADERDDGSVRRAEGDRNPPGLWPSGKYAFSTIRSTQSYLPVSKSPYRPQKSSATRRTGQAHRGPSAELPEGVKGHSFRAKSRTERSYLMNTVETRSGGSSGGQFEFSRLRRENRDLYLPDDAA